MDFVVEREKIVQQHDSLVSEAQELERRLAEIKNWTTQLKGQVALLDAWIKMEEEGDSLDDELDGEGESDQEERDGSNDGGDAE